MKNISPYQVAVFRWILGSYMVYHFVELFPYGAELFSREGILPDISISPFYGVFPDILAHLGSPQFVNFFIGALIAASLLLMLGKARPWAALFLWYGWTCLFNRNPLIGNPGMPYVGLTFVLMAMLPTGEGLTARSLKADENWYFPKWIYRAAFFPLMAGYTYAGIDKLSSPSWVNGEALRLLIENPLARDWFLVRWMGTWPEVLLSVMTWAALAAEISALPLCLFRRGRLFSWSLLLGMHVGLGFVVNFLDLTMGMIMIHLFTFDPAWLAPKGKGEGEAVVFFDGMCGLCDSTVDFLVKEDSFRALRYSPLQGETAKKHLIDQGDGPPGTIIFMEDGRLYDRSEALLRIFRRIGGFARLFSWLRFLPRSFRDRVYDLVARHRYRWFGSFEQCRVPSKSVAELFLP